MICAELRKALEKLSFDQYQSGLPEQKYRCCCHSHIRNPHRDDCYALKALALPPCNAEKELEQAKDAIAELVAQKNGAYSERNKLVAALSKLFPASLERHEGVEWEDDWRWVVFMDLPTGQVSWHLHDSELPQFAHLPQNRGRKWDGHTTEQKYARLAAVLAKHDKGAK